MRVRGGFGPSLMDEFFGSGMMGGGLGGRGMRTRISPFRYTYKPIVPRPERRREESGMVSQNSHILSNCH
jgi:hypothetical protein